jgi:putative methyltransferase (TIGR04325 family)
MISRLHHWVDALANAPGLRQWRKASYDAFFRNSKNRNLFRGVYGSFEEASANAPASGPLGYDNEASVQPYESRVAVFPNDYPAMFWLARSFYEGFRRLCDLGGSVGIKYYAFDRLIPLPMDLRWTVIEVPAAVVRGRQIAMERGAARLDFTERIEAVGDAELLFSSGSIQYLPEPLHVTLRRMQQLPRRILINTAALHPSETYYTVNGIGTAFCPYRIQSEAELTGRLGELGYRVVDRWKNIERGIEIPFEDPRYCLSHYSGLCLDRLSG